MASKQNKARRLVVMSWPGKGGDAERAPDVDSARSGAAGAVRALRREGAWPEDVDLLIVSDRYGLVEAGSASEEAAPVPFTREENPEWWAGFIARNLDNYAAKRDYAAYFVLADGAHEAALRGAARLQGPEATWEDARANGAAALKAWVLGKASGTAAGMPKKRTESRSGQARSKATKGAAEKGEVALPLPLSPAQALAARMVEDSIYSDRFILAISKMSGEEIDEVRSELSFEWGRRSLRRHERRSVSNFIVKSARLPWSEQPATTLYGRLLESFGMSSVLGSINKAVSQLAITEPGRYREILARMPKDESEFMTDLLHLLWEASSRMDKDEIALLRAYLSDSCTHGELRRLGLSRNLWLEDRYEILRSVISCQVGLAPFGDISDYRRVWVRLDEIENILGYGEHDRWELVKALGTLVGDSPHCVTLWMNISPASTVGSGEIQAALENNLRITDDLVGG